MIKVLHDHNSDNPIGGIVSPVYLHLASRYPLGSSMPGIGRHCISHQWGSRWIDVPTGFYTVLCWCQAHRLSWVATNSKEWPHWRWVGNPNWQIPPSSRYFWVWMNFGDLQVGFIVVQVDAEVYHLGVMIFHFSPILTIQWGRFVLSMTIRLVSYPTRRKWSEFTM